MFSDYFTNHNMKLGLYLVKCDYKLAFNNFTPHIKTDIQNNTSIFHLKSFLLCWIEYFILKGYKFSHIIEMKIKTNSY